jgi:predicted peptidase
MLFNGSALYAVAAQPAPQGVRMHVMRAAATIAGVVGLASGSAAQTQHETGFLDRIAMVEGVACRYQVYVPVDYSPAQSWPIIVYLHGASLAGNDGVRQTFDMMGDAIRRNRNLFPAIVVFPQAQSNTRWEMPSEENLVVATIDATLREFHGDENRVSLAGGSMGGRGVMRIASRWPTRFAALLDASGPLTQPVGTPESIELDRRSHQFLRAEDPFRELAKIVRQIPILITHSDADEVGSVVQARQLVAALKAAGADVHYTEYSGLNHIDSISKATHDPSVIAWLLEQRRGDTKSGK